METELSDLVWSQLVTGMRVRWVTPSFVRRGTIVQVKGASMTALFDGFARPTVIPDARQYFCDWKSGRTDYQLVPIDGKAPEVVQDTITGLYINPDEDGEFVSVAIAANLLGTDAKNIRRKLRAGTLRGRQEAIGGRWEVLRESIKAP